MIRFKIISVVLCFFAAFFLCSCFGYRETNEGLVVAVVGVDKSSEGFTVTAQAVIPSDSGTVECESVSATAEGLDEAFEKMSLNAVKPLIFEHCSGLAIGKVKDTEDIFEIISYIENKNEIKLSINLFYTDNAEALISASSYMRQGGYDITQMIKKRGDDFDNELYTAVKRLSQKKSVRIPIMSVENQRISIAGVYIIEDNMEELIK